MRPTAPRAALAALDGTPLGARVAHVLAVDRAAAVAGASALELALGLPLSTPLELASSRDHRVPAALQAVLRIARTSRAPRTTTLGPWRIETSVPALLRVLSAPGRAHDAEHIAALVRALRQPELRALERLALAVGCPAVVARAAFLAGRAAGITLRARPRSAPVLLRPGGLEIGTVDAATGVRVNAPHGLGAAGDELEALRRGVEAVLGRGAGELLALAELGVPLDEPLALAIVPGRRGARALAGLLDAGMLAPSRGRARAVAPLGAAAEPSVAADLADRALRVLDADPSRRADAVRVSLAARSEGAVERVLAEAARAIERGDVGEVERWLARLPAPGDARVVSLRARLLERRGWLDEALALVRPLAAACTEPEARARLGLDLARLAWRRGRAQQAERALRDVERLGGAHERGPMSIERWLLRASMAEERGALAVTRRYLSRARAAAEAQGDEEGVARVLRRTGTLEARCGRPSAASGAYRAALAALERAGPGRDPSLTALLCSNLATTEGWLGHYELAEQLYLDALALRANEPIEALNTRAALELLRAARGQRPPGGAFGALSDEAERLGEPRLRAELALYRAEELAFDGRPTDARPWIARARTALAELAGAELSLEAMTDVVECVVRARRGERAAGPPMREAVDRLVAAGLRFHAARMARLAATAHSWLGEDDTAVALVELAARLSGEAGISLGSDPAHAVALVLAATRGSARARAMASASLEAMGAMRVLAALRRERRDALASIEVLARWRGLTPHAVLSPSGPAPLTDAERDALLARADAIVLDRAHGILRVPGRPPRSLARMRQVEPLLAHLAARRPDPVPVEELARVVWKQRATRSVVTAITTSIARLRKLLAPHDVIRTFGAKERRAYGVELLAPLHTLERRSP